MTVAIRARWAAFLLLTFSLTPAVLMGQDVSGTVLDREGAPVIGARVRLEGAVGSREALRPVVGATRTDDEGRFRFSEVPDGPVAVIVKAPGLERQELLRNRADERADLVFNLGPGRSCRLRFLDREGQGVVGARLSRGQSVWGVSDASGSLLVDGLPRDGELGGFEVVAPGAVSRTLVIGMATEQTVSLEAGVTLVVQVRDDRGRPVEGCVVQGRIVRAEPYSAAATQRFTARSAPDGVARLEGVPANQAFVIALDHPRHQARTSEVFATPRSGSGVRALTITRGHTLRTRITDGFGRPISGASVRLVPMAHRLPYLSDRAAAESGEIRQASSGDDGDVLFERVPAGPRVMEVRVVGHGTRSWIVRPERPAHHLRELRLERARRSVATHVDWEDTLLGGLDRARDERLPAIVSLTMDGERSNDRLADVHYRNPEVARHAALLPMLLANAFGPGGFPSPAGVEHGLDDAGNSTRYGTVPPATFQATEVWARTTFFPGGNFTVPLHLVIGPDLEVLERREFFLSERDLVRLIVRSVRRLAPERVVPLARERWRTLVQRLAADALRGDGTAARDLVTLAHGGEEHAIVLLRELGAIGLDGAARLAVLDALQPACLTHPASALRPFLEDPEPRVRARAIAKLAPLTADGEVLSLLAPHLFDEDFDVSETAATVLGVRDTGLSLEVARVEQGERWRLLLPIIANFPSETLLGVDEIIARGEPVSCNALLDALARHTSQDAQAYEPLYRAAIGGGIVGVRALHVLQRTPLPLYIDARDILEPAFVSREVLVRRAGVQLARAWNQAVPRWLLDDVDPEVRALSAFAILERDGEDAQAARIVRETATLGWARTVFADELRRY